jgi:hypothetical protein
MLWVVAIDNLSYLAPWLSDCMCRLSTGPGISGRSLYTNADEFWDRLKRPQLVTGIPKLVERADFASCTIYVELPAIPESQRLTQEEREREFVARWPRILGCLLEVVARTLATAAGPANLPRMADFGVWMACATPALGWHPNKFTDAYTANRALAAFDVVERDTMGPAVLEFVDSQQVTERPDGRLTQRWEGRLLNALPVTPETRKQKGFPHPNTLPDHLRRPHNSLAAQGDRDHARQRKPGARQKAHQDDRHRAARQALETAAARPLRRSMRRKTSFPAPLLHLESCLCNRFAGRPARTILILQPFSARPCSDHVSNGRTVRTAPFHLSLRRKLNNGVKWLWRFCGPAAYPCLPALGACFPRRRL